MSNGTQLRQRLRVALGDTGDQTVWSDELLDDLLVEAAGWYSRLWPMQATAYRDVAAGQRTFEVPAGAHGISAVECPPGRLLAQEATGTIGTAQTGGVRQIWSLWGGTIYLGRPASGDEVGTLKMAMRVLIPWDRLDPNEEWNGPEGDERLLVLWAETEAWAWLDGQDQKRGRPGKAGLMARRCAEQLELEVSARRRAAVSREMDAE